MATSGCRATQPELERLAALEADARQARSSGDWGRAVERWGELRRADPARGTEAHLGLAEALLALHRPRLALDALDEGVGHFPADAELRRARGRTLVELGRHADAHADLAAAASALPEDPLAWCELAELEARLGRSGEAADSFDRALGLEGCPRDALVGAAWANLAADRPLRAHGLFARAVELAPEDAAVLADALAAAVAVLDAAELDAHGLEAHELAGVEGDAREWGRRACELDPQDTDSHATYARLLERAGELDAAAHALRRAVEVDPLDRRDVLALARLEVRRGRHGPARELFARVLALTQDGEERAAIEAELAELGLEGGEDEPGGAGASTAEPPPVAAPDEPGPREVAWSVGPRLD